MTMRAENEVDSPGWLLFHSVGRFPGQAAAMAAEMQDFAQAWCANDDGRWAIADAGRREAFALWAELIKAPVTSIMAAENVTTAFSAFIEALPAGALAGRSVLIADDCFPSLHFLLNGLAERIGFTLVTARRRPSGLGVEEEDLLAAWDARVALGVVTWVTSTASRRADLGIIIAHARAHGSLVAANITQAAGILPFDIEQYPVDFAASTCLKWMCGAPGAGIGYVAPGLIQALQPRLRGWFSQPDPFNWNIDRFGLAEDARRFDHGTPSYLPYIATLPGLRWLHATGVARVRAHNLLLCRRLIEIADSHNLCLVSPRDEDRRGGTIVVGLPVQWDPARIQRELMEIGLICDCRGTRMRWSPGLMPQYGALEALDSYLGQRGR
jgi:selenocysteine lyase/cysteine desulfurase